MSDQPKTAYYQTLPRRFAETQWTTIVKPSAQGNSEALGRGALFAHLKEHLAAGHDLEALSKRLDIPVNTLKSDLRRLRRNRLPRLLAEEVRRTLDNPTNAEVEEELAFIRRFATTDL